MNLDKRKIYFWEYDDTKFCLKHDFMWILSKNVYTMGGFTEVARSNGLNQLLNKINLHIPDFDKPLRKKYFDEQLKEILNVDTYNTTGRKYHK